MPEGVKVFLPLCLTKLTFQTITVFGNWGLKGGISIDADSGPLDAGCDSISQGLLYLDGRNSQNTFIKSRLTFKL